MNKYQAFTLIELLLVLLILAILLSVGSQNYHSIVAQQALQSSTQQLYRFLDLAKSQAIKNNQQIYVHFCEGEDQQWRMAQSEDNSCDCFEIDTDSVNYCAVNGEQFNQPLADGHLVFVDKEKITFTTGSSTYYTSYKPMRFSIDSGSLTLTDSDKEYALAVIQSTMRTRICAPESAQFGYAKCTN